jgi:SAM-dependent methyltransferase
MTAPDATRRFTDRVDAYVRARPAYPDAIVTHLARVADLAPAATIVDLGVGTGLSAEPFLRAGYAVIGVEPNEAMRRGGDEFLAAYPRYRSVAGSAEASTLPDQCAQLAVAAQAFHWFDAPRARAEAIRLLTPPAWTALMWNDLDSVGSDFAEGYERLRHAFGIDYAKIRNRHAAPETLAQFFGRTPQLAEFRHTRELDWALLAALTNSSSYMPNTEHPRHAAMMGALRELFAQTQREGRVRLGYTARVYYDALA